MVIKRLLYFQTSKPHSQTGVQSTAVKEQLTLCALFFFVKLSLFYVYLNIKIFRRILLYLLYKKLIMTTLKQDVLSSLYMGSQDQC
jgi:hypothetical protein